MSANILYSLIYVAVNGSLLTEHLTVSMRRITAAQVIKTVAKGWAGLSPGARFCEIDVDNAIPSSNFELDPGLFMQSLQNVEIQLQLASKQGVSKGFIVEDSFKGGVDSPSGLSFKFLGTFPLFL